MSPLHRLRLLPLLLPLTLTAQGLPSAGRWVNVDSRDIQFLVLTVTPEGAVYRMIPAPGFDATWQLADARLALRMSDGSADSGMVVRGDTILREGTPAFRRLGGAAGGTWGAIEAEPMYRVMTLRSDGQAILEVGFSVTASREGDTLRLVGPRGPALALGMREEGDTLHLTDASGRHRRLVRRPWGCFGTASDNRTDECPSTTTAQLR